MLSSHVGREEMRRERAGFTLIELMISLTMLTIVLGGLTTVMVGMQRGYTRQRETARSEDALRNAELTISSLLRYAGANSRNIAATSASFPRIDPFQPPFDSLRVLADITNGANPPVPDADVLDPLEDVLVFARNDTLYVRWQAGAAEAPVAWPVRTLLFQFDSSGTIWNTNIDAVRASKRVRVTLEAPKHSRTTELARRESWIYLRNRW
jgi:prepilin-type N-terminal cleavage/methylation domain-containing protein